MPDGCRTIEKEAFSGQNTIARIIIPEGVTTLESCAISNCDALETIEIPSTVTYIDRVWTDYGNSFCYCKKLTSINVSEDNKHYSSADGILFDKQKTILYKFPAGKNIKEYEIPNTVKTVEISAFKGGSNSESIIIPNIVTYISSHAFEGTGIRELTVPGTIKFVDYQTFYGCTKLEKVVFCDGLESIGWNSFRSCVNLKEIRDSAFSNCKKIENLNFPTNNDIGISTKAFDGCVSLKEITIPLNVISIGTNAFGGSNLTINCEVEESNIPTVWSNNWYGSAKSVNYGVKK